MNAPATDTHALETTVIAAFASVSADATNATRDTEILALVDSLGFVMALANLQQALDVALEPDEIIDVFQCRSVADVALTLQTALSSRLTR